MRSLIVASLLAVLLGAVASSSGWDTADPVAVKPAEFIDVPTATLKSGETKSIEMKHRVSKIHGFDDGIIRPIPVAPDTFHVSSVGVGITRLRVIDELDREHLFIIMVE